MKFYSIGRKGTQFLARTKRAMVADFLVHDRVPFSEVKVAAQFMVKQYLDGEIDTIEAIYPRFKNTLVQYPETRPILPLRNLKEFLDAAARRTRGDPRTPLRTTARSFSSPARQQVLNALLPFYVDHADPPDSAVGEGVGAQRADGRDEDGQRTTRPSSWAT